MSRFDLSVLETAQKVPGKPRHKTREVKVGNRVFGGSNPIWVQSMTTSDTFDEAATVFQDPLAAIFPDSDHSQDEVREIIVRHSDRNRLSIVDRQFHRARRGGADHQRSSRDTA